MRYECYSCGLVEEHESDQAAWKKGWDLFPNMQFCGDCASAPWLVKCTLCGQPLAVGCEHVNVPKKSMFANARPLTETEKQAMLHAVPPDRLEEINKKIRKLHGMELYREMTKLPDGTVNTELKTRKIGE